MNDFWALAHSHANVKRPTHDFVNKWLDLASWASAERACDDKLARSLIRSREQQLKGGRARLGNPRAPGWKAHMWTGSANATEAGFNHNVELLVQLTGKKAQMGVDAFLGQGTNGLRALLTPFFPPPEPVVETASQQALNELIRVGNLAISTAPWVARAARNAGEPESYTVTLALRDGALTLPQGCSARAWPLTLPADRALALASDSSAIFERCSFQALTAFFTFELRATDGSEVETCEFVVKVALEGAPEDRQARVLHALLDDPAKVLRFLRLLLSLDAFEALELLEPSTTEATSSKSRPSADDAVPLFESLVRTLDREPARLLEVDRVVRELRTSEKGAKLLSAELLGGSGSPRL